MSEQLATVACAMIVRDAETSLARACESILGHVDELIIVDTGSRDATRHIAQRYTDRLYQYAWRDDFSAARQYAFDQATSEWVMHLDADDEVLGAGEIRLSCACAPLEVGSLLWRYVTQRDSAGAVVSEVWRERCVRRGWYRWEGRAHEVLVPLRESLWVPDDEVIIEHWGYADPAASARRNVRILRAALAEEAPTRPRTLFFLARDLLVLGEHDEALPLLQRYLAIQEKPAGLLAVPAAHERYMAQLLIAHCHRQRGETGEAEVADSAAAALAPNGPAAYFGLPTPGPARTAVAALLGEEADA